MPQTGAAGSRRSGRGDLPRPPAIVPFDPLGEITVTDSRAAARAALADAFAERFGIDEDGPSAAALADRFGFRYAEAGDGAGSTVPTGRRTVAITGRGARRAVPPAERTVRPARGRRSQGGSSWRAAELAGFRADRIALCAVALGLLLAFVAATSAHAVTLSAVVAVH